MWMDHPIYGPMRVPDSLKALRDDIDLVRNALEIRYNHRLEAYKDCLEERLDLFRR